MSLRRRYLIAIPIPPAIETTLRNYYQSIYHEPLKVKFLHITIIPPFYLNDDKPINLPSLPYQPYSFGPPNLFTQHRRNILYLPISPSEPLTQLHQILKHQLDKYIEFDTKPYTNKKVPSYKPHVTLSYNFKADPAAFHLPIPPFHLPRPELLVEQGPGMWKPVPTST